MHIHRSIKVGIRFVVTHGTAEQFSPLLDETLAVSVGEPLPLGTAAGAILTGPMRIDFDGDDLVPIGFGSGHLESGVFIEMINMPPELLVALLAFDRLARLPLFLGNAPQMAVAMGIQAMIGHKGGLNDPAMLPDGDHRQILDIEIDRHRDQVRIVLAFHHQALFDLFDLRDVQFRRMRSQDQGGAVDVEAHKRLSCIERLQIE
jgi:hypothetical protein